MKRYFPWNDKYKYRRLLLTVLVTFISLIVSAQLNTNASYDLIKRVLSQHAAYFAVESLLTENEKDVFEKFVRVFF